MSIFGFYFVGSLLREAGWPRNLGMFKGSGYDITIVDSVIDQMVDWAAAIGAGRPELALKMIAEMFRDRDWAGTDAPNIKMFIDGARWDTSPDAAPREVVQPVKLAKSFGKTLSTKDFQDARLRVMLEQQLLEALLWGLSNPRAFATWYSSYAQRHEASLPMKRQAGLDVGPLPTLSEFFDHSEELVRNYEREVSPLPSIPPKLAADARALGWKFDS